MGEKLKNTKYALDGGSEAKRLLGEKVTVINEFNNDTEKITKEINKRKCWIAPN